ncbi:MAG: MaoC family dehydratase [Geminicoccaceae bacterium]|nr:MaoC family dehydratase [Geminicoccaceae bacterium]
MGSKTFAGNHFEDFELGQRIAHATPRTVGEGDVALYTALTGSRFAQTSAAIMARRGGLPAMPVDDLLAFHIVFGKTVPDISLNATANLGYADGRFLSLVYPGDTLLASSEVIGLKETSSGKAGIVWVRTKGVKADGSPVVEYVRWVMVKKRDPEAKAPESSVPDLPSSVPASSLAVPKGLKVAGVDPRLTGSPHFFEDYAKGERIDHLDGMTVTETDHRLATRLYQNTAKVHFNDHAEKSGRLGRTIVYGGVVLSIAKALSFNGLGNALHTLAINAGTHANPCVAGDTVYAWSEVLDAAKLKGRDDVAALRLRLVALKDAPAKDFPLRNDDGKYRPEVLLDFDYWALMPTRAARLAD